MLQGNRSNALLQLPMNRLFTVLACTVSVVSVSPISVAGETTKNDSAMELARQEQNPLARFIRLQVEDNVPFGFGPDNDALNFLRLQPTSLRSERRLGPHHMGHNTNCSPGPGQNPRTD